MSFTVVLKQAGEFSSEFIGLFPNYAEYEITGDSSYATGGAETVNLDAQWNASDGGVIAGPMGVGVPNSSVGGVWYTLLAINVGTPTAVKLVVVNGGTEAGSGTDLSTVKWRIAFWGKIGLA